MAEKKSEGLGSLLGNPSALLALVTIVGGLWLVSQKLTSDRPVTPAGSSERFIGDQKMEARLWEDPFKHVVGANREEGSEEGSPAAIGLNTLADQIRRRSNVGSVVTPFDSFKASETASRILLLPVMVSGGQYSEDQESRIRSRFAVVSALGRAGYVPEDAEHLGELRIPWLTQQEVEQAKQKPAGGSAKIPQLWEQDQKDASDAKSRLLGIKVTTGSAHMEVRYEWYRPRVFSPGSGDNDTRPVVLVLWLDDSSFEDDPLLRLPLFLERLTDARSLGIPELRVALIGPRRSSTLRNMLPNWQSGEGPLSTVRNPSLEPLARNVLRRIEIFCATPSAMDEVLIRNPKTPDVTPRASVREKLTDKGLFKAFHNFAATDAQMAHEILDELALRGADLSEKENHVVLLSEWDTFYARMLSMTYGAELALLQRSAFTRAGFVDSYISQPESAHIMPVNFHSLIYLRGLDGQTVDGKTGADEGGANGGNEHSRNSPPSSVEELRHWAPDVNKAEGRAQFDYLGRLGDRVDHLRKSLQRERGGEIRAIGIVGSDVYDTLLILQALRERFPEVLFFTTDLDVRFFHPREREWARNLIVASSYGLALQPGLQGAVTPFRDSTQTAQFAAVLAALGNAELDGVARIPPRRFEIGNRTAVDLSIDSSVLGKRRLSASPAGWSWLHPWTASEMYQWQPHRDTYRLWCGLGALILLLAGASWGFDSFRRLTWEGLKYPCKALDYSEEDIGGPDGVETLLRGLDDKPDVKFAQWLVGRKEIKDLREKLSHGDVDLRQIEEEFGKLPPDKPDAEKKLEDRRIAVTWEREKALSELTVVMVKLLNQFLRRENPEEAGERMPEIRSDAGSIMNRVMGVLRLFPPTRRVIDQYEDRRSMDAFFDQLSALQPADRSEQRPRVGDALGSHPPFKQRLMRAGHEVSRIFDVFLGDPTPPSPTSEDGQKNIARAALQVAAAARKAAKGIFRLRCRRLAGFWLGVAGFGTAGLIMVLVIWRDTFARADGEPFSLTSGTSAWPAEVVRLLVLVLAVCFGFELSLKMREAFLKLSRSFRLAPPPANAAGLTDRMCAQSIWYVYREGSRFRRRWRCIGGVVLLYFLLLFAISAAFAQSILRPLRGDMIAIFDVILLAGSILGFLLLAFLTVDAARLCRDFIEKISENQTRYPEPTRRHFSREKGWIDMEYLDEWIDLQLIAELTDQVGRLVYYPAGLVLLMLLARNSWWDCWSWPLSLVIIFTFNFILALASVVILQCAAKEAKRKAEKSLTAKVKKLQAQAAPSVAQNNATQAEKLLEEIRQLDRGAFVPFWENPVVGAVFLSSGGTTMLQLLIWFMGR
jgi:hypothetical protein